MRGFHRSAFAALLAAATALVLGAPAAVQAAVVRPASGVSGKWTVTTIDRPPGSSLTWFLDAACSGAGSCVAVGNADLTEGGKTLGYFTVTETHGHWGEPVDGLLPTAEQSSPDAAAGPISCPAAGYCVLLGTFPGQPGPPEAFIATQEHGSWVNAFTPTFLAGQVSCTAINRCEVVGTSSAGRPELMSMSETAGRWHAPVPISFPGAGTIAEHGGIQSLSCIKNDCVAVATLNPNTWRAAPVAAVESTGHWRQLPKLKLPRMRLPKGAHKVSELSSVSCQPSGTCTAVGAYGYTVGTGPVLYNNLTPMFATLSHGRWSKIVPLTKLPSRVPRSIAPLQITNVTCARAFCLAAGYYQHVAGVGEWLALRIAHGRWQSATAIPVGALSGDLSAPNDAACAGDGYCAIVGGAVPIANADGIPVVATGG
jgi:hypothetical protein